MQALYVLYDGFQQNPSFFIGFIFVIGALIGSFLNVVIYRLPIMMEKEFKQNCDEYFGDSCTVTTTQKEQPTQNDVDHLADSAQLDAEPATSTDEPEIPPAPKFNLVVPRSRCPHCGHQITAWENLPIISYLVMGGKCTDCKTPISIQYPFVEFITALASAFVAAYFGVTWECLAALCLTWCLVALTGIDIKTQLLPDVITLPLLWLGLLLGTQSVFVSLDTAVWGAALGYLSLWSIYHLFKLATGKEGMGYGDFKLLAALCAWMGASMIPLILIISTLVGSVIGLGMIVIQGRDKAQPMAFGPYLAIAGWIAFFWGDRIMGSYLGTLQ